MGGVEWEREWVGLSGRGVVESRSEREWVGLSGRGVVESRREKGC